MGKNLFFIALIPNPEITAEVTAFKEYAALHFQSLRALRSPAHITLIPPFKMGKPQEVRLIQFLTEFAIRQSPFILALNNFDAFAPRVIYVKVDPSQELNQLQSALEGQLLEKMDITSDRTYGFHAHMTVAFKDLKKAVFPAAWSYYSAIEYRRDMSVNELSLLKHNGRIWEAKAKFAFE